MNIEQVILVKDLFEITESIVTKNRQEVKKNTRIERIIIYDSHKLVSNAKMKV